MVDCAVPEDTSGDRPGGRIQVGFADIAVRRPDRVSLVENFLQIASYIHQVKLTVSIIRRQTTPEDSPRSVGEEDKPRCGGSPWLLQ